MRPYTISLLHHRNTGVGGSHLVNQIRKQTLRMIDIQRGAITRMRTDTQRSRKFHNRNACATDWGLAVFRLVKAAGDEDFAEEVSQGDVAAVFEG